MAATGNRGGEIPDRGTIARTQFQWRIADPLARDRPPQPNDFRRFVDRANRVVESARTAHGSLESAEWRRQRSVGITPCRADSGAHVALTRADLVDPLRNRARRPPSSALEGHIVILRRRSAPKDLAQGPDRPKQDSRDHRASVRSFAVP